MSDRLPKSVVAAGERAEQLQEALRQQQANPAVLPPQGIPNSVPTEQQTPPEPPPAQTPPVSDGQTPPAQPPAPTQAPVNEDTWQQRYKVLRGKYDAEVPRLAAENKGLKQKLDELAVEVEKLKQTPPAPLVTEQEIEEFGPGLVDLARRIAREELAGKDAEIQVLKQRLEGLTQTTAKREQTDYFTTLDTAVSDWRSLNEDPAFLGWLDEVDELTGEPRGVMLARAHEARDGLRVAKFFQAFKKTSATWAANSAQALAQQVAPAGGVGAPAPQAKKVWTRAEINDFYGRMRQGLVSDQEAVVIEADIHSAQIEGRIR